MDGIDIKSRQQQIVEARTGRELEPLLRELSIEKRYTDPEIAQLLGVSKVTVITWRKRYGISLSDRRLTV